MTEKLKCPFCGSELQTDNEIARLIMWRCHTPGCLLNGWHSAEIIQHLIDGKKAQDALKHLSQELCYLCMDEKSTKANLYKQINELFIYSHNAIGEITSITKQEK